MKSDKVIKAGGWCLIILALLWVGGVVFFDIVFGYPAMISHDPANSLTALLSRGASLRICLLFYALTPLLLIPGSIGAFCALRNAAEGAARTAKSIAVIVAITAMLGLFLWGGVAWHIATFLVQVHQHETSLLSILFVFMYYFGLLIGNYVAQGCLAFWVLLQSYAIIKDKEMPSWYGVIGWIVGIIVLIAIFLRMASISIYPDIFIELVPLNAFFMFIFGVGLLAHKTK